MWHNFHCTDNFVYSVIDYIDNSLQWQFFVPKRTSLYWKSLDRVTIGYSDTFVNPHKCHCNQSSLYHFSLVKFLVIFISKSPPGLGWCRGKVLARSLPPAWRPCARAPLPWPCPGNRGGIQIFYDTEKPDKIRSSEENQAHQTKITIFGGKQGI